MGQAVCFSSDRVGQRTQVLTLDGECDGSAALEAEQRILSALGAGRTEIVYDLRGLTTVDSSMLHALFRGLVRSRLQAGKLLLIRPNACVWTVFELSGLDRVFPTSLDLKDALASAPGKPRKILEPGTADSGKVNQ
jgi:anti-sigma B factor antagonist